MGSGRRHELSLNCQPAIPRPTCCSVRGCSAGGSCNPQLEIRHERFLDTGSDNVRPLLQAGGVAAAVCTIDGNISVWPTVSTSSGLLQARISQEVTCVASIILPSQTFIIVCGTAHGRLYRVDCVAQAHAAHNQALSVIPLQQAEVA